MYECTSIPLYTWNNEKVFFFFLSGPLHKFFGHGRRKRKTKKKTRKRNRKERKRMRRNIYHVGEGGLAAW